MNNFTPQDLEQLHAHGISVEKAEEHPKAQLAYSYDIALQNELTIEENIALARRFLQEQFVSR